MTARTRTSADTGAGLGLGVAASAALDTHEVLARLGSSPVGLTGDEAAARLRAGGPNAVRTHHAQPLLVLARQLRSPLLVLLAGTALLSFFLGDRTDTVVIGVILVASVALSFANEYRAERASDALHSQISHRATALRGGASELVDVSALVPGDVVRIARGEVVPADLRLLEVAGLQCDEGVLTGESLPVEKDTTPVPPNTAMGDLTCCALMGTVVTMGDALGAVVATGPRAEFGRIASGLGSRHPETEFQAGLRRFSGLLLRVALVLTTLIFAANVALHRPLIDAVLFSLAIAVGITPQLLPAVVSTSLATGSRELAKHRVLVKRLVSIEDLGDMDILVTDKTGTLTTGRLMLTASIDPAGQPSADVLQTALLAAEPRPEGERGLAAVADPLERAMWESDDARALEGFERLGVVPFDHDRRLSSALVRGPDGTKALVVKGAPEAVLHRAIAIPPGAEDVLRDQFSAGRRVIAVATRSAPEVDAPTARDETKLTLRGFLVFLDPPKPDAAGSLSRLQELGVNVTVCTGDNATVAERLYRDLGLASAGTLSGPDVAAMDDSALSEAARTTTIFARVSPEQKARIVGLLRHRGRAVGFLGDGVNDALALHKADVGLSVDTAVDVAKDAADIILMEKDLGVLADGIVEGRRIFANTVKYVLMGTSSNFGNMFSAAAASAVLSFLPMLPGQILLNNLLYDASQLAIPTDRVDPEQLRAPSHWDIAFIRKFMVFFGPISSLFDFLTFALMLGVFSAGPDLFRAGWFAESLATQTLIIFAIRTRRPFLRSRPSTALMAAALGVVALGVLLPLSPLANVLGFARPPLAFYGALAVMVAAYLLVVELAKRLFFAELHVPVVRPPAPPAHRHLQRRASRFSVHGPLQR
jgi:Mg2+-importing ATPase